MGVSLFLGFMVMSLMFMGCLLLGLFPMVSWVWVECCLERSSWLLNPL
jgi:hypothetical protein